MVMIKSFMLAGLAAVVAAKSAVLDLVPSNFDDVVLKSGNPTFVEFFAPWCGHCKKLAPIYEDLAASFSNSKNVQIAKVDADAEKDLGSRYKVQGFPTLKFFDGKSPDPTDYDGPRDLESLIDFVAKKTGAKPKRLVEKPSAVTFLTDKTWGKVIGKEKNVMVAFTAPWCGHCQSLAPIWEKVAEDYQNEPNVLIAKVDAEDPNSKGTARDQEVKSYPTIKFFPAGSKEPELYGGQRSEQDFVTFLNEKAGTHRIVGGGLDQNGGTIEALNTVVEKYIGGKSILADALSEAKKHAGGLKGGDQHRYAEYYVRVLDKLKSNDAYVTKELARLEGILKKGGLAPTKSDELTSKTNILRRFIVEKDEAAKDEAAKDGAAKDGAAKDGAAKDEL